MSPNSPQSAVRNPQSVELRIEELVLEGFAPADRHLIAEAVESELARLLAELGVPHALARIEGGAMLNAGDINVAPGSGGKTVGAQVARAVYGSIRA
jgi:hypothetical protein